MSFWGNLFNQINPFDNGKTWSNSKGNTQPLAPQPQRPGYVFNQPQRVAPQVNVPRVNVQALNQALQSIKLPTTANPAVIPHTPSAQPQGSLVHQLTHNPVTNTIGNVAKGTIQQAKTAGNMINATPLIPGPKPQQIIENAAKTVHDNLRKRGATEDQASQVADQLRLEGYSKLLNNAGIGLNDSKFTIGRKAVGAIGGTAMNVLPVGEALKAASLPLRVAKGAAFGAAATGVQNLGADKVTLANELKAMGAGAAMGGALPIGVEGIKAIHANTIPLSGNEAGFARMANDPHLSAIHDTIKQLEDAQRTAPNVRAQNQFGKAIDSLIQQRAQRVKEIQQGGFARIGLNKQDTNMGEGLGMEPKSVAQAKATMETPPEINAPNSSGVDTSVKHSNLKPNSQVKLPIETKSVNPLVKTFANKVTVLRHIDTPSSHEAADAIVRARSSTDSLLRGYENALPTANSLKGKDFENAWLVAEGKAKPISDVTAQAAKELTGVMKSVDENRLGVGLNRTGSTENYMPHQYDWAKINKDKNLQNNVIDSLVKSGKAKDATDAVSIIKYMSKSKDVSRPSMANFDIQRGLDVPGYKISPDVLHRYLANAAETTANAQHFGSSGEIANKLVGQISKEGGDSALALKALDRYMKAPGGDTKLLSVPRGVMSFARLGKAPISHAAQSTNIALVGRTSDMMYGQLKTLIHSPEDAKFVQESGVVHPSVIHAYTDQYTGIGGKMSQGTALGLKTVMIKNRTAAAFAGRRYGNWLASKGDTAGLTDLGVTGDIGKTLTHEQTLQAAKGMADKTMFSPDRSTTPVGAETASGKTIGQFRTAYAYKQSGLLYNKVLKPAMHGDFKGLVKFGLVSSPVGFATMGIKQAMSGKNNQEGLGGKAMDMLAAMGGIPGELAVSGGRYTFNRGKENVIPSLAGMVAPIAGEGANIALKAYDTIHGNPKSMEKYGVGLVPVAGTYLANKAFPSSTPTTKATPFASNSSASPAEQKTQATADIKQIRATAKPGGYGLQQLANGHFAVTMTDGSVSDIATYKAASAQIAKDSFDKSGGNFKQVGDMVYRRASDGAISSTPKIKFDYSVMGATMTMQKNQNDLNGWLQTAKTKLDNINQQLSDPSIDPLDKLTLNNDAATIKKDAAKYLSYGGFTKATGTNSGGESNSVRASIALAGVPKVPSLKISKMPASKKAVGTKSVKFATVGSARQKKIKLA